MHKAVLELAQILCDCTGFHFRMQASVPSACASGFGTAVRDIFRCTDEITELDLSRDKMCFAAVCFKIFHVS